MIIDLKSDTGLIILSYLELEDVLILFKTDISFRNKVIHLYFKNVNIDQVCEKNHLLSLQYLIHAKSQRLSMEGLCNACRNGHLDIIKFIIENELVLGFNILVMNSRNLMWI